MSFSTVYCCNTMFHYYSIIAFCSFNRTEVGGKYNHISFFRFYDMSTGLSHRNIFRENKLTPLCNLRQYYQGKARSAWENKPHHTNPDA